MKSYSFTLITVFLFLISLTSFTAASLYLYYENIDLKNDVKNLSLHMENHHHVQDSLQNVIDSLSHELNH